MRYQRQAIRDKKRHHLRARRVAGLLLVFALLAYTGFCIERRIRPVIVNIADYESRRYAVNAFNDAVAQQLAADPDSCQSLVHCSYADDGTITAINTDTYAMNLLASQLVERVERQLDIQRENRIPIAVGTLSGVQALIGYGPNLYLQLAPETYVTAQVYDTLESAGINQTQMALYVRFCVEMSVILSGYSVDVRVQQDVCLSHFLLAGTTPQNYWKSR